MATKQKYKKFEQKGHNKRQRDDGKRPHELVVTKRFKKRPEFCQLPGKTVTVNGSPLQRALVEISRLRHPSDIADLQELQKRIRNQILSISNSVTDSQSTMTSGNSGKV